jgi:hypothetical protein
LGPGEGLRLADVPETGLEQINLALVYFDIVSEKETCLVESFSAGQLQAFFEQHCLLFLHWAEQEMAHREGRNHAAQQLSFPMPISEPGQRHLAESVFKAVSTGRCLMAQAPTGIGKTVGTLFPMLKALAPQQLDKGVLPHGKNPGTQTGTGRRAGVSRQRRYAALAGSGNDRPGQGLRAPGQRLPR